MKNLIIFLLLIVTVSAEPVFIEIEENETIEIRTLEHSNIYPIDRDGFYTLEFETYEDDLNECNSEKTELEREQETLELDLEQKENKIIELNNQIVTFSKDKEIYSLKEKNNSINSEYMIYSLIATCCILFVLLCSVIYMKKQ